MGNRHDRGDSGHLDCARDHCALLYKDAPLRRQTHGEDHHMIHLEPVDLADRRAAYCATQARPALVTTRIVDVADCQECLRVYDLEMSNRAHKLRTA